MQEILIAAAVEAAVSLAAMALVAAVRWTARTLAAA